MTMAPSLECHHRHECQLPYALNQSYDRGHHETNHLESINNESDSFVVKQSNSGVLRKLKIAALFCIAFLVVELVGGAVSGSLAVLSDAAHRATDVLSYLVAIMGSHMANFPPSKTHTFGFKRVESLVALFSMVALIAVTISLTVESIRRISKLISSSVEGVEDAVDGKMMTILAVIGISLNVVLACVLGEHHVHMPTEKCHGLNHTHEHGHCHSHNEGKTWLILMELYCM